MKNVSIRLLFFPRRLVILRRFILVWRVNFYWIWLRIEIISLRVRTRLLIGRGYERGFLGYKKRSILLKYFIVQFFAGASLLGVFYFSRREGIVSQYMFFLLLGLKLRLVPFHSWVLDIFRRINIIECYIIRVIPKVRPLVLISNYTFEYRFLLGVISVVGRAALGLIYSDIRHIFACSSIITTGWLCIVSSEDIGIFFICFLIYRSLSLVILFFIYKIRVSSLLERSSRLIRGRCSYKIKIILSLILFRYIRLPFFLTFILKLMVVISSRWYIILGLIISVSRVSIVIYSRIIINVWSYDDLGLLVWVKSDFNNVFLLSLLTMLVSILRVSLLIIFM